MKVAPALPPNPDLPPAPPLTPLPRSRPPAESYAINFDSDAALAYVPSFPKVCGLIGSAVRRHDGWMRDLTPPQPALVERIDGLHSLEDLLHSVLASGTFRPSASLNDSPRIARRALVSHAKIAG